MAWMNQERKAKIVAAAKPILAKYGMKATFRCTQHSITCTLKSGYSAHDDGYRPRA
jgi:hypothetical protein